MRVGVFETCSGDGLGRKSWAHGRRPRRCLQDPRLSHERINNSMLTTPSPHLRPHYPVSRDKSPNNFRYNLRVAFSLRIQRTLQKWATKTR